MFIDVWLLHPRLRTNHDRSAHDQLVFIVSNTVGSCTKSIRRSPRTPPYLPRGRFGGDAYLLVSYQDLRNLEETSTSSLKYHGYVGMSENLIFPRRLPMLKVQIP